MIDHVLASELDPRAIVVPSPTEDFDDRCVQRNCMDLIAPEQIVRAIERR